MSPDEILQRLNNIDNRMAVLETHMETLAVNQMHLSSKFGEYCNEHNKEHANHSDRHLTLEGRLSKTETRSGFIAGLLAIAGGLAGWLSGK